MSTSDPRSRLILHLNWHGQALPVLLNGLPSKRAVAEGSASTADYSALPQPSDEEIDSINPYAQILKGIYRTPTFLIHGTTDDLIPWQQSAETHQALVKKGIPAEVRILEDLPHLFDMIGNTDTRGSEAVKEGFDFLATHAGLKGSRGPRQIIGRKISE